MNTLVAMLTIILLIGFLGSLLCLLAEAARFVKYEMKLWRRKRAYSSYLWRE